MFIFLAIGAAVTALAHMWPAPFVIDWMAGERAVWEMPRTETPTVYLTYDDGPNPSTTPDLLDVLKAENVPATFFIIDAHLDEGTAPIVTRAFAEGHSVALHSATRRLMLMTPAQLGRTLTRRPTVSSRWPARARAARSVLTPAGAAPRCMQASERSTTG